MIKIRTIFVSVIMMMLIGTWLWVNRSHAEILPEQPTTTESSPINQHNFFNPNATCGDFLRDFDPDAPEYFKYDLCEVNDKEQAKLITVIYKIDGQYAKQAEQYIMAQFHTGALIFLCCLWTTDNHSGAFINPKDNTYYYVAFESEETLSSTDWRDLDFYLVIQVSREEV